MTLKFLALIATVVFSALAAICWFKAGNVRVSPEEAKKLTADHLSKHGPKGYARWTTLEGFDMEWTLVMQSKWNCKGAFAAGAAAISQAIYVIVTEF